MKMPQSFKCKNSQEKASDEMITVIGSLSMDYVVEMARMPAQGETIIGDSFANFCGGKGANQAVGIARLGHKVAMLGCVGDDVMGQTIIENLQANNVDTTYVRTVPGMQSGSAHIFIEDGDNRIVVVKGANDAVDTAYIAQMRQLIAMSDVVLMQYEIPTATIELAAQICREEQVRYVINPAPMKAMGATTLAHAAYITPNEIEAAQLYPDDTLDAAVLARPEQLIVTLGEAGVMYADSEGIQLIPARKTTVVDTTGAGDAFNAGFVVGIAEGMPTAAAITFGNKVASFAIQKLGAQSGMPTRAELATQ